MNKNSGEPLNEIEWFSSVAQYPTIAEGKISDYDDRTLNVSD